MTGICERRQLPQHSLSQHSLRIAILCRTMQGQQPISCPACAIEAKSEVMAGCAGMNRQGLRGVRGCAGPCREGIPPVPDIGTDDLHPPLPGIPREFPGPDSIPFSGGKSGLHSFPMSARATFRLLSPLSAQSGALGTS